jgi:DNA-binding beta-propeller fold protein YncE
MRLAAVAAGIAIATSIAVAAPRAPTVKAIALPAATPAGVFMDYLASDRARHRVWVPAGNTGRVDVIDTRDGSIKEVAGFPTKEVERNGKKRVVGPSSASVGDGVVFVGNRADSNLCAVDAVSLARQKCVALPSSPDGVAYVAATKEVWVTAPRDNALLVLDAATLTQKARIEVPGQPEGYAVDGKRGRFYTNLEDKDRTLAIDLASRAVVATWLPACGEDGPKGLAIDETRNVLFVACTDKIESVDAGSGRVLSTLATGAGVDNIDWLPSRKWIYAAAGQAAKLTIAAADDKGALTSVVVVPTSAGARNAVAGDDGAAWVTDSRGGKILQVSIK